MLGDVVDVGGHETVASLLVRDRLVERVESEERITGKCIWVIIRWVNSMPKSEKWTWAGRHTLQLFFHGKGPGLIVVHEYVPSAPVRVRPTPVKFWSIGAGCWSRVWMSRPAEFACQISTSWLHTGRPGRRGHGR